MKIILKNGSRLENHESIDEALESFDNAVNSGNGEVLGMDLLVKAEEQQQAVNDALDEMRLER